MSKFPFYQQPDEMDCGPTCLRMIAKYYGKSYTLQDLRQLAGTTRQGSNLLGISEAAEKIGFRTLGTKTTYENLKEDAPFPCIAHWNQNHFVVIYKIKKSSFSRAEIIYIADPGHGILKYTKEEFLKSWKSDTNEGVLLLLEPTPDFYTEDIDAVNDNVKSKTWSFLFQYILKYKKLLWQLIIGLIAGSILQLIFPFITQSIVDIGVQNNDLQFIYLLLFAQLMLFFGRISIEIIRGWILMHVSNRVNISLVSDFFVKLMKLPISFFDVKMTGDLIQRIEDHHRIENFLTSSSLNVLFSFVNLIIFSIVLLFYSIPIFTIFLIGSIFYFAWISFFLKRRANLNYKRFSQNSQNQSKILELIGGMQEIKLHNAERQKRWQWEKIQTRVFKINIKNLSLEQAQNAGSGLINELKNILITFLSAKLVIDGEITLGMMLSISYIIGQLNAPVIQLVTFTQNLQDASISLERLSEIHNEEDEEPVQQELEQDINSNAGISLKEISFQYTGNYGNMILKDLNMSIPPQKVTAIVGASGSGKTTLLKLLLKFYEPSAGEIKIDLQNLNSISPKTWRNMCGSVMQEGYIFSDSIASNIALGADEIDKKRLQNAARVANIETFIDSLPLRYNTKIGQEGLNISTGEKQRILIARAVYKNPDYLFFDEATSALDANNEKVIMNNLKDFFKGKTVVVIAHRLSTVKNADQIIVLDQGKIVEQGSHTELTTNKKIYYELVKNQLELGN
ncbi:MAG: peptidase domain-containing ABC transporter [Bacteroidota bacterium]